jgi:hypothetical protein
MVRDVLVQARMTKLISVALVLTLALAATACLDNTPAPWQSGGGVYADGSVTSPWDGAGDLQDITVAAREVGGDPTIVNSETYARFDHGFKLDLPGGRYTIDVKDAADHVIATYPDVVVDGEVTIGAPTEAAQ